MAKKANGILSWCSDPTTLDHGNAEVECVLWTSAGELGAHVLCPCIAYPPVYPQELCLSGTAGSGGLRVGCVVFWCG